MKVKYPSNHPKPQWARELTAPDFELWAEKSGAMIVEGVTPTVADIRALDMVLDRRESRKNNS